MLDAGKLRRAECSAFLAVTGRSQVKLNHPTAKAYNQDSWDSFLEFNDCPDNRQLYDFAKFVHSQLSSLRAIVFPQVFKEVSKDDAIYLSIAAANTKVLLASRMLQKLMKARLKSETHLHSAGLALTPMYAGEFAPNVSFDDIVTWTVDRLPNWLALANEVPIDQDTKGAAALTATLGITSRAAEIEQTYQDTWQNFLWQPLTFSPTSHSLSPKDIETHCLWTAWWMRYSSIGMQNINLDSIMGPNLSSPIRSRILKTVITVTNRAGRTKIRTGIPTEKQTSQHQRTTQLTEESYLGPFLGSNIPTLGVDLRTLIDCWLVLRDLSERMLSGYDKPQLNSKAAIRQLSGEASASNVVDALSDCLSLNRAVVEGIVQFLTTDPTDVSSVFRKGMWAFPLINSPRANGLLVAYCALKSANIVRVLSIWIETLGLSKDLEGSTLGQAFEQHVRESCESRLGSNSHIDDFAMHGSHFDLSSQGGEEIDIMFRIGHCLVVGEIKCFLLPADPIERYSFLKKLDAASEQAERKANWVRQNLDKLPTNLLANVVEPASLVVKPLVVVNQSVGVGLSVNGVPVTDSHWLNLLLTSGEYASDAVRDGTAGIFRQSFSLLYRDTKDLARRWDSLITNETNIRKWLNAVETKSIRIPTADGRSFEMIVEQVNQTKLIDGAANQTPHSAVEVLLPRRED